MRSPAGKVTIKMNDVLKLNFDVYQASFKNVCK